MTLKIWKLNLIILCIMTLNVMLITIMTLSIMPFSIMILSILFSHIILSIIILKRHTQHYQNQLNAVIATRSIYDTRHKHILQNSILSVVRLNVVRLNVVRLNVVRLNVVRLNFVAPIDFHLLAYDRLNVWVLVKHFTKKITKMKK
jgi:hypothetical protein